MTINKMLSKTDTVPRDIAHFIWAYCKRDLTELEMRNVIAFITHYHCSSRQQKLELTGRMPASVLKAAREGTSLQKSDGPECGSVADSTLEK